MFSNMISVKNADRKKFDFWKKIHESTPLRNFTFSALVKTSFFGLKMIVFFYNYRKTMFSDIIIVKNSKKRNFDFWTKFLENVHFLVLFKTLIFSF